MKGIGLRAWLRHEANAIGNTAMLTPRGTMLLARAVARFHAQPRSALRVASMAIIGFCAMIAILVPTSPVPTPQPLAVASATVAAGQTEPRAPLAAAAPAWTDIIKPIEIFNLDAADFAKARRIYMASRDQNGGRRDVIALGPLMGPEPAIRLSLYRGHRDPGNQAPLFPDLARLAAQAGLSVARSGLPDLLPTRFGSFEVVTIGLAHGIVGAAPATPCSGFRLVHGTPSFTITGLACGGAASLSRLRLRCLLDRIDLTSGGDKALVDFFAATDLRRDNTCKGMDLGPAEAHAANLDNQPATPARIRRRHRGSDATVAMR